jgi:hypothetical protein
MIAVKPGMWTVRLKDGTERSLTCGVNRPDRSDARDQHGAFCCGSSPRAGNEHVWPMPNQALWRSRDTVAWCTLKVRAMARALSPCRSRLALPRRLSILNEYAGQSAEAIVLSSPPNEVPREITPQPTSSSS